MKKFLLFGDVHYAGPAETRRGLTETEMATSWAQKTLVHFYRNFLWLADPIGHAHKFPQLLDSMNQMRADEAVCLGDFPWIPPSWDYPIQPAWSPLLS